MSVKLMSRVWETLRVGGSELTLLLALADISNDQGDNIRPGVSFLAWKANVSERTVQSILDRWKVSGALSVVAEWNVRAEERRPLPAGGFRGGRGIVPVYRLDLSKFPSKKSYEEYRGFPVKGAESASFSSDPQSEQSSEKGATSDPKGCNLPQERVQIDPSHNKEEPLVETQGETQGFPFSADAVKGGESPASPAPFYRSSRAKAADSRFAPVREHIKLLYHRKYGEDCPNFEAAENVKLSSWLRAHPSWSLDTILRCVDNLFASVRNYGRPRKWLGNLEDWLDGPKDEYGVGKGSRGVKSSGRSNQDRQNSNVANIWSEVERMQGVANG